MLPVVSSVLRMMSGAQKVLDKYVLSKWVALSEEELGILGNSTRPVSGTG